MLSERCDRFSGLCVVLCLSSFVALAFVLSLPEKANADKIFTKGLMAVQIAVKAPNGSLKRTKRVRGWYMANGSRETFDRKTDYRGWAFFKLRNNDVFANGMPEKTRTVNLRDFKLERIEFSDGSSEYFNSGNGHLDRIEHDKNLPIDLVYVEGKSFNVRQASITLVRSSKKAAYYYMGCFPFSGWSRSLKSSLDFQAKAYEKDLLKKHRNPFAN